MSGERLFDSPAPMPGQLGLEHEHAEAAEAVRVEHPPLSALLAEHERGCHDYAERDDCEACNEALLIARLEGAE